MDPWSLGIGGVVSLLGALFGGGDKGTQMSDTQRAMLEDTLNTQNQRMKVQNPLYEMATRLAMNLMPRSAGVSNPQLYNPYTQSGYTPPSMGRDRRMNTREGTGTEDAVSRLAGALPPPTTPGAGGLGVRDRAQLFRMPPGR